MSITADDPRTQSHAPWRSRAVWFVLLVITIAAKGLAAIAGIPGVGALEAIGAAAFVVLIALHCSLEMGWRGFAAYLVLGAAIGLGCEAISIRTGFPFGWFVHHMEGPRIFDVPFPVLIGYPLLGWPAWCLARLIVRPHTTQRVPFDIVFVPIVAAFIFSGYDLAYDPVGATVEGLWTFRDGGGLHGVPLPNFLGWLFTGALLFLCAWGCERAFSRPDRLASSGAFWFVPIGLWAGMALPYLARFLTAPSLSVERGGVIFQTGDIHETALILALFTHVFVAAIAAARFCVLIETVRKTDAGEARPCD